jgi:hypothetical protein
MNRVPSTLGSHVLPLVLLAASLAACATGSAGPTWTFGAPGPAPSGIGSIDGYVLGPQRVLTGDQFHRLEATARTLWRSKHPDLQLAGFEVRAAASPAQAASAGTTTSSDEYLVVVSVARGRRHVVVVRCDRSTFPAPGSCS